MSKILVTGSANGLGATIVDALEHSMECHDVYDYDLEYGDDVCNPTGIPSQIDVLINCAGVNITGWLDEFTEADWDTVVNTNAKGIFKMTQACLPQLIASKGTVLNIVSNASHMPMTTSLAYNASKGAAHIMTLQLARELTKKYGITVFGISPNKLRGTKMSKDIERQVVETRGWTPEFAAKYQADALLCGEETDPMAVANLIAYLLRHKNNHKYLTGCIIPYGA